MGSYYNLMPEETFFPTAIFLKFWVVSSTTFDRGLRTASRNVNSENSLEKEKKLQYCFFFAYDIDANHL